MAVHIAVRYVCIQVEGQGHLVLIHHGVGNLEHGGEVAAQVDHAAAAPGEGHEAEVVQIGQLFQQPAHGGAGEAPPLGELGIVEQGIAGAVAEVDHRPQLGAQDPVVLVDGGDPQVQHDVHLGGPAAADEVSGNGDRQEEKAGLLLTGAVVVQHGVMPVPAPDGKADQLPFAAQPGVADQVLFLKSIQDGQSGVVEPDSEPLGQLGEAANPFPGIDRVGDAVQPTVGGAEVGVGAEHGKIKKTGASAGADASVCHQDPDKVSIDAAAWVVHQLL